MKLFWNIQLFYYNRFDALFSFATGSKWHESMWYIFAQSFSSLQVIAGGITCKCKIKVIKKKFINWIKLFDFKMGFRWI